MDTDESPKADETAASTAAASGSATTEEATAAAAVAPPDVGPYSVENPTRVVPAQARFMSFRADSR